MKKEQITKFDLESAFKALDEIEIPKVRGGIKSNRVNLKEATKRVDRLSLLVEDYYNLGEEADLQEAAEEREDEIAKAKLARIEKIVDLDAESEDDILPSYAGKMIIQCPQCMTLFYKKPEDVIISDDDPDTVNVGEECQHCGNNDGYSLIGKVAAVEEDEVGATDNMEDNLEGEPGEEEVGGEEELPTDLSDEGSFEEEPAGDENVELEPIDTETESEEELKEAAFQNFLNSVRLEEAVDPELNKKLEEHDKFISYLQSEISNAENELKNAKNEEIKKVIQTKIDNLNQELESALPDAVKDAATTELPDADILPDEAIEGAEEAEIDVPEEAEGEDTNDDPKAKLEPVDVENKEDKELKESTNINSEDKNIVKEYILTSLKRLQHGTYAEQIKDFEIKPTIGSNVKVDFENSQLNIGKNLLKDANDTNLLDDAVTKIVQQLNDARKGDELNESQEDKMWKEVAKNPATASEVEAIIADEQNKNLEFEEEELQESSFNKHISAYLTEVYGNVDHFELTNCHIDDNKLITEGIIYFKSGKNKSTSFTFTRKNPNLMEGYNKDISDKNAFWVETIGEASDSVLCTTAIKYNYEINGTNISGNTGK